MSDQQPTVSADEASMLSEGWRTMFAVSAAAEVQEIASLLQAHPCPSPTLLRGLGIRLEHLSAVVSSAISDELETEQSLFEVLHGPEADRQRKREESAR